MAVLVGGLYTSSMPSYFSVRNYGLSRVYARINVLNVNRD
jgi:hypothetical protein